MGVGITDQCQISAMMHTNLTAIMQHKQKPSLGYQRIFKILAFRATFGDLHFVWL